MKNSTTIFVFGSILAYLALKDKKVEASETPMFTQNKIETISTEAKTATIVDDKFVNNTLLTITAPIANTIEMPQISPPSITTVNTPSSLSLNLSVAYNTQSDTQTLSTSKVKGYESNSINTESIVQPLVGDRIYAEYKIPIYSIINRSVTDSLFKAISSFGSIDSDLIDKVKSLRNIDWERMDTGDYSLMAMNIAASYITGGLHTTLTEAFKFIVDKWLGGHSWNEEQVIKTPDQIMHEIVNTIKNWYKRYNVTTKNGIMLGFLAKNRISSSMIPIFKAHNPITSDDTFIPIELIPVFTSINYEVSKETVGYASKVPFENSRMIVLMHNILLSDYVVVQSGTEYERILSLYNYIPVTTIGFVSNKVQNGQEDSYIQGSEIIDYAKNSIEQDMNTLFGSTVMKPDSNIQFNSVDLYNYKYNPTEQLILPNSKRTWKDSEYYHINTKPYTINTGSRIQTNSEYYSKKYINNRGYASDQYILDPDLAIDYLVGLYDQRQDCLIYNTYKSIKSDLISMGVYYEYQQDKPKIIINPVVSKPDIESWRSVLPKAVVDLFFKQVLDNLEIIRLNSLSYNDTLSKKDALSYVVQYLDGDYWNMIPGIIRQFYVKKEELYTSRYTVNGVYGGILIPPRGFYTKPIVEQNSKTITVRGENSKIIAGSVRMLIRLKDGSLLELFSKKYDNTYGSSYIDLIVNKVKAIINIEPEYAKRIILSGFLDITQGRPAYDMDMLLHSNII